MIHRFAKDSFADDTKSTVGVDLVMRTLTINDKKVHLKIWDTSGSERYRSINRVHELSLFL